MNSVYARSIREQDDRMRLLCAYSHVKDALNEVALVIGKDKYINQILGELNHIEDTLYQYTTAERKGVKNGEHF
jgi:hypothetical protein